MHGSQLPLWTAATRRPQGVGRKGATAALLRAAAPIVLGVVPFYSIAAAEQIAAVAVRARAVLPGN
eukprot:6184874-Pleurochrysis_carterae.AAC.7